MLGDVVLLAQQLGRAAGRAGAFAPAPRVERFAGLRRADDGAADDRPDPAYGDTTTAALLNLGGGRVAYAGEALAAYGVGLLSAGGLSDVARG